MSHIKKRLLNIDNNLEYKEFQEKEKLSNILNKLGYNKFLEKLQQQIIMQSNIYVNTFLNISQKGRSSMLPRKEKLKNMNIFQLKDKLSIIPKQNLDLEVLLLILELYTLHLLLPVLFIQQQPQLQLELFIQPLLLQELYIMDLFPLELFILELLMVQESAKQ